MRKSGIEARLVEEEIERYRKAIAQIWNYPSLEMKREELAALRRMRSDIDPFLHAKNIKIRMGD